MVLAELISDVGGMDLYDHGLISEAYKLNCVVEQILDSLKCPVETPLRTDALVIRGLCTDNMALSKRQEGLYIRQRCKDARTHCFKAIPPEKVSNDDKIRLFNSYTDLVCSQQQINDFEGVRHTLNECLEQYRTWGTEDDPDLSYEYAKHHNQMAYVLLWENSADEAVEFAKKAYELVETAAPGTGIQRLYESDYAHILFQQGGRQEELQILERLLRLSEKDCGKGNVRTLEISLDVGIMSYFMDDFSTAE
jgi:tetratricopeptide (TPR) repeat protein